MKMADALQMLEWKNYPETRKFTIATHKKIKEKDHFRWLEKNVQYFRIIEDMGVACGAMRIQDKEISVWIDREVWGVGYARDAINKVAKKGYTAKIVEGHIKSMRLFIKCGFKPISYQHGYYIFQK